MLRRTLHSRGTKREDSIREFEVLRNEYNRELQALRRKYAKAFTSCALRYNNSQNAVG